MRTNVLISRISRLVETVGESGEGALLADEYATAVNKANTRLEAVIAAADAKSISDAIRLLNEEPPLLEEISTLDFFQLQDWESLCDMNGWKNPPKIDKRMVERAVELGETKDAIAPFLSMYKKAIRVNNVRLAVKSLRRLSDLDHSQDWSRNLRQAEKQLQTAIVAEFEKALSDGQKDSCDRLAQELLDGAWLDGLTAKGVDELREYRAKREAAKRDTEGRENIAILRKCLNEKWDRKLAFSMIRSIDGFVEQKWTIPEEDRGVVEDCRLRCAKEFEEEEAEKLWREANEKLHKAIQTENCEDIRAALALPVFLDRDPMSDMLSQAHAILEHAEAARRRKTLQIVVFSFLCVMSALGVSGWWLKQKLFENRCADETEKLAYLEEQARKKPRYAIDTMASLLRKLKSGDPKVYNHPKVIQFEARLAALVSENNARTNRIAVELAELERMKAQAWSAGVESASVTGRIGKVESLLAKDDNEYEVRFLEVKNSWIDHAESLERERRNRATKFQATLVSHLNAMSGRLRKELAKADLKKEVENCKASLEEWKSIHSKYAEESAAGLAEAEKTFQEALDEQCAYTNALGKLDSSKDAIQLIEARNELIQSFSQYPEIKQLKPLEVGIEKIKDALSPQPALLKTYIKSIEGGVSKEEFDNFIKESVSVIADSPEYYSVYGLVGNDDLNRKIGAVSKGKPDIDKPSYETSWKVTCNDGLLLSMNKRTLVKEMRGGGSGVTAFLMPSSDEMRTVVEIANRSNLSMSTFENEILRLIGNHLLKSHAKGYLEAEEKYAKYYNPVRGWWSPYRRVQFLAWYMRWLREDLKVMPEDREISRWYEELERLAGEVKVDDIDESLAWICIWDDRIKRRTIECARLLNRMPADWVARYRAAKAVNREFSSIDGWKIMYAGKVKFDPLDPSYDKNPGAIRLSHPGVAADHPLYVLRMIGERLTLVRAFEPAKNVPWRKCVETERSKEGYVFGEPLYHVFAKGKFIDVQIELTELAKRAKVDVADARISQIPLFGNGGE